MRFVLVMAAALALAGCNMGQDMAVTDAAIADFHAKFGAGDSAAIVAAGGPELKSGGVELLDTLHAKLGAFKSSQRQGFNDNYNNGTHTFTATYASVYANGPATEDFVYRFEGGKPVLIGYNVKSKALLAPTPAPPELAAPPEDAGATDDPAPSDDSSPADASSH